MCERTRKTKIWNLYIENVLYSGYWLWNQHFRHTRTPEIENYNTSFYDQNSARQNIVWMWAVEWYTLTIHISNTRNIILYIVETKTIFNEISLISFPFFFLLSLVLFNVEHKMGYFHAFDVFKMNFLKQLLILRLIDDLYVLCMCINNNSMKHEYGISLNFSGLSIS